MNDELIDEKFKVVNGCIDDLKCEVKNIKELTLAISSVNGKVDTLTDAVVEVKAGLRELVSKPAKLWDNAVWLVIAAFIGYAINQIIK